MAVILCFTRLQTIILCSSPLRRQTATASAEMISNRFSKMSVARLLPYIISLKWIEKKREQIHKSITTAHFTRWKDESFHPVWVCVCVCACWRPAEKDSYRTCTVLSLLCVSLILKDDRECLHSVVSWQRCKNGIMYNELTRWLLASSTTRLVQYAQSCVIH